MNFTDISKGSLVVCIIWNHFFQKINPSKGFKNRHGTILPETFTDAIILMDNLLETSVTLYYV